MKELIELPVEGLTPAMQASLLRELIKQLSIPDDKLKNLQKSLQLLRNENRLC